MGVRKSRLPDGRLLCEYCHCYAPPWKLRALPNGLKQCLPGHGCRKPSDEEEKEAHPPAARRVRPHTPGTALPLEARARLIHPADVFPFIDYARRHDGDSDG